MPGKRSSRTSKKSSMDRPISPPPVRTTRSTTKVTTATTTSTSTYRLSLHTRPSSNPSWHTPTHTLMVAHYTSFRSLTPPPTKAHPSSPATRIRIAAFDLDHTLTATLTGAIHSRTATDWRFFYPCIPHTLRTLSSEGYKIIIFTNQGGLKAEFLEMFKAKIAAVLSQVDADCSVYVARGDDKYRKPRTGMWAVMHGDLDGEEVDMEGCFYVGDAAGREGDHSNADKGFAEGVGLRFYTPEEYFLGEKPKVAESAGNGNGKEDVGEEETDLDGTSGAA